MKRLQNLFGIFLYFFLFIQSSAYSIHTHAHNLSDFHENHQKVTFVENHNSNDCQTCSFSKNQLSAAAELSACTYFLVHTHIFKYELNTFSSRIQILPPSRAPPA